MKVYESFVYIYAFTHACVIYIYMRERERERERARARERQRYHRGLQRNEKKGGRKGGEKQRLEVLVLPSLCCLTVITLMEEQLGYIGIAICQYHISFNCLGFKESFHIVVTWPHNKCS
jgi:hypothetical protein